MQGSLNSIVGPMASGKSRKILEIAHQHNRYRDEGLPSKNVLITKPANETRESKIHTRDPSTPNLETNLKFSKTGEFEDFVRNHSHEEYIVIIDEVQFQKNIDFAKTLDVLATDGYEIYASYLSTSFTGHAFNDSVKEILAYSDNITNLAAICASCSGKNAVKSMRLDALGNPVGFNSKLVDIGFNYVPVCRKDHIIPDRPEHPLVENLKTYGDGKLLFDVCRTS